MLTSIWDQFLTIAREEAGIRVVETWFKAVTLHKWDAMQKIIYLQAPNDFVKEWIKNNYSALFQFHLGRLLNLQSPKIVFLDANNQVLQDIPDVPQSNNHKMLPAVHLNSTHTLTIKNRDGKNASHINSSYQFSNFVVGPNNSLAYAAAHAVTEKPGYLYNPLFIYGGSGLGKTHLLHAIGNEIKLHNKNASILYQPADRFVSEFINAIRFDKMYKFQNKYKDVDVLLIDDIQFISNKETTQEAFFHIFNSLYDAHKQLVFSSDTFPQNIHGIAERLRSRLACGLVTDIYMPGLETKIAILKKKAELSALTISDEVAHFIASRPISNIRELEGALVRVIAFASLTKQTVDLELAKKVLLRISEQSLKTVDFELISKIVQKHYNFSVQDLQSKNRSKDMAFVRQISMYLMKKFTDRSLRDIGMFLGGRDHSTVMYAINKIDESLKNDENLQLIVGRIEQEITG